MLSVNFPIIMIIIIITLLIPTEVITSLNPFSIILMMKRNHPCCVIIICLLHTTINASKLSYSIYYKNLPSLLIVKTTRKYTQHTHHCSPILHFKIYNYSCWRDCKATFLLFTILLTKHSYYALSRAYRQIELSPKPIKSLPPSLSPFLTLAFLLLKKAALSTTLVLPNVYMHLILLLSWLMLLLLMLLELMIWNDFFALRQWQWSRTFGWNAAALLHV